jgi:hypothetical protein
MLKSTMVIFFIFHFAGKSKKNSKASFHTVHRFVRKNLNFGLHICRIFSCVIFFDGYAIKFSGCVRSK